MPLATEQAELRFKAIRNIEEIRSRTQKPSVLRLIEKCLELLKKPFFEEEKRAGGEIVSADVRKTSYSACPSPAPDSIQSAYDKPLLAEIALETGKLSPRLNRKDNSPRSGALTAEDLAKPASFSGRMQHSRSFSEGGLGK